MKSPRGQLVGNIDDGARKTIKSAMGSLSSNSGRDHRPEKPAHHLVNQSI